jgi:excisionase family DNA binding protein
VNNSDDYKQYLSITQMAVETSMSQAYWRKAVFHRQIPIVKVGRRVLIRRSDLHSFMESRRIPAHLQPVSARR